MAKDFSTELTSHVLGLELDYLVLRTGTKCFNGLDIGQRSIDGRLPAHTMAANLRRVFSGLVSSNVREDTILEIEKKGPFEIHASGHVMKLLDKLLAEFVAQGRMKLKSESYTPCYKLFS